MLVKGQLLENHQTVLQQSNQLCQGGKPDFLLFSLERGARSGLTSVSNSFQLGHGPTPESRLKSTHLGVNANGLFLGAFTCVDDFEPTLPVQIAGVCCEVIYRLQDSTCLTLTMYTV